MKTIFTTLFILILTNTLISQEGFLAVNENYTFYKTYDFHTQPSKFTAEILNTTNFKYKQFLSNAKKSPNTYLIGDQLFSKKALTQFIRKSVLKSENFKEFLQFTRQEYQLLFSDLSESEIELLYIKFRQGTFHKYIDELSEII
ncbi:hypothetical protein [Aquimarina addita]